MIIIRKSFNRIELNLIAFEMGNDICVVLKGGEDHLGAVTVGSPELSSETIAIGSHKEYYITEKLSKILKKKHSGSYVICCGIHLDNITKDEISTIADLSCEMVEELCRRLNLNN
jgi:hypothetical protein